MCCDDIIRCVFDFNDLDLNVYKKLKEEGESRADDLSQKLKKERSTVYRSLQKLTSCGLCIKKTNKITTGGYYHTYSSIDIKLASITTTKKKDIGSPKVLNKFRTTKSKLKDRLNLVEKAKHTLDKKSERRELSSLKRKKKVTKKKPSKKKVVKKAIKKRRRL